MAFFSSFVYILTLLRKMKFNIKAYERKKKKNILNLFAPFTASEFMFGYGLAY